MQVPCPGIRGAEGPGQRQGVTALWGLQAAWNAGAGRGTRTRYDGWDRRDEGARKATATGHGAWWNAGASHMHAAVINRLLTEWGLLSLLDQLRAWQGSM